MNLNYAFPEKVINNAQLQNRNAQSKIYERSVEKSEQKEFCVKFLYTPKIWYLLNPVLL